jgi:protein-S-isoprenylcysteine O-methyltransferase Ste14
MRDVVGVSPVRPAVLVAAKAGFAVSWGILGLRLAGLDLLGVTWPPARVPALVAGVLGGALVTVALVRLGEAARVGLPPEGRVTRLKTTGVYSLSRNPVYVGVALTCFASCAYVPHWANLLATLVASIGHHRIVLAEERFLRRRFGAEWQDYRARVRRYV